MVASLWVLGCGGGSSTSNNHAPVVSNTSATPTTVVMGVATQLSVQATDADGDALTYSWAQTTPASPSGTFSAQTASPMWTAPTVAAVTQFKLTVTVSDGKGGTTNSSVTIYVKTSTATSFAADVQPIFELQCVECHSAAHADAQLSLSPADSYGELVNVKAAAYCTTRNRVTPGSTADSVLVDTMIGSNCGSRMPPGDPTFFDSHADQLTTIETWINDGAANN